MISDRQLSKLFEDATREFRDSLEYQELVSGSAAGCSGAGLVGLLFGHGMLGNLGGLCSMLGLIFQLGLIALIAYFVWRWLQRRNAPAYASAAGPAPTGPHDQSGQSFLRDTRHVTPSASRYKALPRPPHTIQDAIHAILIVS